MRQMINFGAKIDAKRTWIVVNEKWGQDLEDILNAEARIELCPPELIKAGKGASLYLVKSKREFNCDE